MYLWIILESDHNDGVHPKVLRTFGSSHPVKGVGLLKKKKKNKKKERREEGRMPERVAR